MESMKCYKLGQTGEDEATTEAQTAAAVAAAAVAAASFQEFLV